MANRKLAKGTKVSHWIVDQLIDQGGNGEVYQVHRNGTIAALKRLKPKRRPHAESRFRTEISVMNACLDIPGVLAIIDSCLTDDDGGFAWYVAELATPFDKKLQAATLDQVLEAITSIAGTLSIMHSRGYKHRDIKPGNLFWTNDGWRVGDFGLVEVPDKAQLTESGEKLGPIYYIAPEMLVDASTADGAPADVYSLAKVLWATVAGLHFPLPGHLDPSIEVARLSTWRPGLRSTKLEGVLSGATHLNPAFRPTMQEFYRELSSINQKASTDDVRTGAILPRKLVRQLSDRTGLTERIAQDRHHKVASKVTRGIVDWLTIRFGRVIQDLNNALLEVEGLSSYGNSGTSKATSNLIAALSDTEPEHSRIHFEESISGSIRRTSRGYVDFTFGVHVSVARAITKLPSGNETIPIDTRPANVWVGYGYGHLDRDVKLYWSDNVSFIIHGTEDETACGQLETGLREHFVGFFQFLVQQATES